MFVRTRDRWFVSLERPKSQGKRRFARQSSTFANEDDAKAFARQMSEQGFLMIAGTLNPALPRRLIPSNKILRWLDGKLDEGPYN